MSTEIALNCTDCQLTNGVLILMFCWPCISV